MHECIKSTCIEAFEFYAKTADFCYIGSFWGHKGKERKQGKLIATCSKEDFRRDLSFRLCKVRKAHCLAYNTNLAQTTLSVGQS